MFKQWVLIFVFIVLSLSLNSSLAIDEANDLSGKIAIIGTDYNMYTYVADSDELLQLTNDALDSRRYQFPTWSTDGRLAYFCCEASTNALPNAQAHISPNGEITGDIDYESEGTAILYASWSPSDCGTDCRDLAMLTNDVSGLAVDVLRDSDNPSITTVGTGQPFYFHWDSTGSQMVFHRANSNLDIYSRTQNDISASLENSSGAFQTPIWSPIDNRILVGLSGTNDTTNLATVENGEITVLVYDITGIVSFLWSPDGRYIAYRTLGQFGYSGLTIIDANTGNIILSEQNIGAISFFWSPDSQKVAYISVNEANTGQSASIDGRVSQDFIQNNRPTEFLWTVLDIETGTNLSYSSFVPTFEVLYLLTYFDQFAPSHRLWSSDSRYLLMAGTLSGEHTNPPQVYVFDTQDINAEPIAISDGVFGIWSFE